MDGLLRFAAGAMLGLALVGFSAVSPARADVEDVVIPVDDKGKTTTLTKERCHLFEVPFVAVHPARPSGSNKVFSLGEGELSAKPE